MANELVIDGKPVEIVEYKGQKVLTTRVMAEHHNLDVRVMNQKFRRNRKHFVEGVDYYVVTKKMVTECDSENPGSQTVTQSIAAQFTQNNMDEVYLFTESGYLRFVKTINDDKAWHIYSQLMQAYFEKKAVIAGGDKFLAKSTENRKSIAGAWAQHGAKDFGALTICEYYALFNDTGKRKSSMNSDELTLLSVFEFVESKKLSNNPQIYGDAELGDSTQETANGLLGLIEPKQPKRAIRIEYDKDIPVKNGK